MFSADEVISQFNYYQNHESISKRNELFANFISSLGANIQSEYYRHSLRSHYHNFSVGNIDILTLYNLINTDENLDGKTKELAKLFLEITAMGGLKAFKYKSSKTPPSFYKNKKPIQPTYVCEKKEGNAVNVACALFQKYRDIEKNQENPYLRNSSLCITANSGLPGNYSENSNINAKLEEEAIFSNFADCVFNEIVNEKGELSKSERKKLKSAFHKDTIKDLWGIYDTNQKTIQGVNYAETKNEEDFGEVYVINPGVIALFNKESDDSVTLDQDFKVSMAIVLANSINAGLTSSNAARKTLSPIGRDDYEFYVKALKCSLRSQIDVNCLLGRPEMAISLQSALSYAGKHREKIEKEAINILNEVLSEVVDDDNNQRGRFIKVYAILGDISFKDKMTQIKKQIEGSDGRIEKHLIERLLPSELQELQRIQAKKQTEDSFT